MRSPGRAGHTLWQLAVDPIEASKSVFIARHRLRNTDQCKMQRVGINVSKDCAAAPPVNTNRAYRRDRAT
jgi:hypothetical protein